MHLNSKTIFSFIILSMILSLVSLLIFRQSSSKPSHSKLTAAQQLQALEKSPGQSADMRQFIKREEDSEQAKQEAADALPK